MVRFDDLALFVRTAALGSFSSAAREADLLPGQASAAVARLERALDLRLFARSTRSLRLTAEGEQYLPYARQVLELLRDGREQVRGADSALHGVLQVTAPSDLGRNVLLPWLTEFRAAHPKLTLRLHLSDQVADLYRALVDVAFRLGRIDDADHVALPVAADNRRVLVAAPAYLQRQGAPPRWMRCASTPACCTCWPGAPTTVGNSTWTAVATWCRCAARCCATTPMWYGAGRSPAKASPTSRGWTCAPTCRPGGWKCCCPSAAIGCRCSWCARTASSFRRRSGNCMRCLRNAARR